LKSYVNGVEVSQTNSSLPLLHSGDLFIGGATVHYYDGGFNGLIDEFRIYNRALSAQEVQTLYALGVPPPPLNILRAIELRWISVSDQVYQVQTSTNLVNWTDFGDPISTPSGTTNRIFDSVDADRSFYRLQLK
jgi:hypothetical protein